MSKMVTRCNCATDELVSSEFWSHDSEIALKLVPVGAQAMPKPRFMSMGENTPHPVNDSLRNTAFPQRILNSVYVHRFGYFVAVSSSVESLKRLDEKLE